MVEYSKVNVKLSDTQLKKLKTAVKDKTGTTLRKLRNSFDNNMSTDLKLSKAQISKIIQSGGFLGSLLSKIAGPLMKITVPLAKNVSAPLGITAAASAIDAGTQEKVHGSGNTNEE